MKKLLFLISIALLTIPLVAQDDMDELPAEVVVAMPGIRPEGIEWDADAGRFLLGSLTEGTIFQVIDDEGTTEPFIENEDLVSTVGIEIDEANGVLLVPNSDSGVFTSNDNPGIAGLFAFDLETGELLYSADLTAFGDDDTRYFANDTAVDSDGNAYITNSFAPVIYQVTPEGDASVFIEDEALTAQGFGLNGIDYHHDGYLLAAVAGQGAIYKIPVDDPASLSIVEMETSISIDGLYIHPDGTVVAIGGIDGTQYAVAIKSEDDWATAEVVEQVETGGAATTITVRAGVAYFINAYLNNPNAEQYEIVRVDFSEDVLDESAEMMMDDMGEMEETE